MKGELKKMIKDFIWISGQDIGIEKYYNFLIGEYKTKYHDMYLCLYLYLDENLPDETKRNNLIKKFKSRWINKMINEDDLTRELSIVIPKRDKLKNKIVRLTSVPIFITPSSSSESSSSESYVGF